MSATVLLFPGPRLLETADALEMAGREILIPEPEFLVAERSDEDEPPAA